MIERHGQLLMLMHDYLQYYYSYLCLMLSVMLTLGLHGSLKGTIVLGGSILSFA